MKTILKGFHVAINQFTGIAIGELHNGKSGFVVKFTDSCAYEIDPENQADWNKLCGQSWGFFPLIKQYQMHYNSSRFGWRYNTTTDCIEVAAYYYVNGQRFYENDPSKILSIPRDIEKGGFKEVYLGIIPLVTTQEVIYTYCFDFKLDSFGIDFQGNGIQKLSQYSQNIPNLNGFSAPIYFGGQTKAPHTIKIGIKIV